MISYYASAKRGLSASLGVTEDLLHMHAGLIIFFLSALIFRRRMRSRVPVGLVWLFAIANEIIDAYSPGAAAGRWEPAVDILNTVFWPMLLFLLARRKQRQGDPDRTA